MHEPGDLVDEMREALRRAESFGDIFGIIDRTASYGMVLPYQRDKASHDEADTRYSNVPARASMKHKVVTSNLVPATMC